MSTSGRSCRSSHAKSVAEPQIHEGKDIETAARCSLAKVVAADRQAAINNGDGYIYYPHPVHGGARQFADHDQGELLARGTKSVPVRRRRSEVDPPLMGRMKRMPAVVVGSRADEALGWSE